MSEDDDIGGGGYEIAIVGMAVRVPGAKTPEEYWHNLRNGIESVQFYDDDVLIDRGVPPELVRNPDYVKAGAPLDEFDCFDPDFFGFSPKEAGILDPQHRQFYECAWEAMERAGHTPSHFDGAVGVFAGCGMGAYFSFNILTNPELINSVGLFLLRHTGNDKDFLSTRVSYNFDLKGPSVNVQTACSTSAVATHLACQSLLSEECDMALAGGVTLEIPHGHGYMYKEGEILSPDGHCRAFDHRSKGTIFGSGTGVVVLRRLEDALEDGDHIHAVILGTAVNNDGSGKVGYLAPSVDGQAQAVAEALAVADVEADSIGYVECHGTGTPVGDPIEVSALTQAFRESTDDVGFCGIGSVKTNIGHLDTAAGVASLIKAALAVEHGEMPPSLNYEKPNPTIDFETSPFYVNNTLQTWQPDGEPRRAAINSLGVGGTNAFLIIEQPPEPPSRDLPEVHEHVIAMSAKSRKSLDAWGNRLADFLESHEDVPLTDVAYSLLAGREGFEHRRVLAGADRAELIEILRSKDQRRLFTHSSEDAPDSAVFMFPGGGAQYVGMGRDLYEMSGVFAEVMDEGLAILATRTDTPFKEIWLASNDDESADRELQKPSVQLPLIFMVEYALARQWMDEGLEPAALIGHSMGENAAACLAGVMSYPDALGLVLLRGQLMDTAPSGGMLSVQLSEEELKPLLGDKLDLAGVNSPGLSVASGADDLLDELAAHLDGAGIEYQRIPINIAAHSRLLDGILEEFRSYLNSIALMKPSIPIISNRTGEWLRDEDAMSADYWVGHLRNTVRFADGIDTLVGSGRRMFLEVGPGNVLGSLTRQNPKVSPNVVLSSMRHPEQVVSDRTYLRSTQGRIWACGFPIDVAQLYGEGEHRRVPLPTYAFQHQPYWIEPGQGAATTTASTGLLEKIEDVDRWIRTSVWVQQGVLAEVSSEKHTWLVFLDHAGFGTHLVDHLRKQGHRVVTVTESDAFFKLSNDAYLLSPEHGQDGYQTLISDLEASGMFPDRLLHLWLVTDDEQFRPGSSFFHRNLEFGFYSLFFFGKAMADAGLIDRELQVLAFTNGMQQVNGEALNYPEKATILGATRVLPREFPGIDCRVIDLDFAHPANEKQRERDVGVAIERLSAQMLVELGAPVGSGTYAYRDGVRWEQRYDHFRAEDYEDQQRLRQQGCYLVTGGLGGIGHVIAMHLAETVNAELILVNRTPLPDREEWDDWLRQHGYEDRISRNIRNVRELEQAGAHVTVEAGDVTDVMRMRQIVEDVERSGRQINGVIHAAGTVNDNLIQLKQQHEVEDTFAPKVYGTLVLDELFKGKPLDFFVLFSSTSTVIAPVGQIDYVAANAFINAYAQQRNAIEPGLTLALNWGVWNEVGMAAETAAQMGYAGNRGKASEVPCDGPLFDRRLSHVAEGMDRHVLQATVSAAKHWILDQHRTRSGQALWPGTGYLELIRSALREVSETGPFQVQELTFLEALYVPDDTELDIRVKLNQTLYGYDFQLQSLASEDAEGQDWVVHAEARIGLNESKADDVERLPDDLPPVDSWRNNPVIDSAQEVHLNFGAQWKVLRGIEDRDQVAFGFCHLDDVHAGVLAEYRLHPGMLDIATGFAMHLIPGYNTGPTRLWVPVAYRNFSFERPLTQTIISRVRKVDGGGSDDFASFEIALFDDAGKLLVAVERLTLRQLTEVVDFGSDGGPRMTERQAIGGSGSAGFRQLSAAELAFQHNLSQGIRPREGCATFSNALNLAAQPELIISSLPLEPLIIEAGNAAMELHQHDDDGAKFARPDLDNDYVEPRDDIDRTLVGFWEDLLGVDGVGIEDNFFDLGGHSLVAVRLFSKIQQKYEVDYPISVLFEAPTISECADMIRESVGDTAGAGTDEGGDREGDRTTRYTHLVPMHSTKNENETPFFFVAGMFGNVLNLRHLAQLIGNDRPFYGLQARGLYGDHSPHETFEEMAADYIAEMMTVQSEGPYLLGGFSGGGITAYEICRQLIQAGHEVKRLVMLDTPLPHEEPLSTVDKFAIQWQNIQRGGVAYFREWAVRRVEWELRKMRGETLKSSDGEGPTEFQNKSIEEAFRRALTKYQLERLDVDVKLFRPRQIGTYQLPDGRTANAERVINRGDNRWTPYVRDLEIFEMPGDHDSMVLEPNVRVLANKLAECLK